MSQHATLVVVGASLAGASAAVAARETGFDGRIVLIGDEPDLPYERPPLSKAVLRGEAAPDSAAVHSAADYADRRIELLLGRTVTAIEPPAMRVLLDEGEPVEFSSAVIATGSSPRKIPIPGADLDGVHYLRAMSDACRLRDALEPGVRVAVIGAGWIGTEVAASARQVGAEVVMVDPAQAPLLRVLGSEIGRMFADLHAEHGVDVRLGTGITEIRGDRTVRDVALADGSVVPADVVVIGVGVQPRLQLAQAAGLPVADGITVDDRLRSAAPGIYAAGDVAAAWHPRYERPVRVEHWANALNQGRAAGINAVGGSDSYDRVPYFFSDQYDLGLEYVGLADPDDPVTIRGELDSREFIAFWQRDGRVTAAMNVNVWDVVDELRAIITSGASVDPARLADPDVPLSDVVARATA